MGASEGSRHVPIWPRDDLLALEPVPTSLRPDVCVVGAGVAGLTVAYRLLRRGRSVLVLEREGVGAGETSRSTAHLAFALDDRFVELERWHGTEGARLAAEAHERAIATIERVCEEESIDCGFRRLSGFLVPGGVDDDDLLARELAAARRAGLDARMRRDVRGLRFDGVAIEFPNQAELDPVAYLAGLDRAVRRRGGHVAGPAEVVSVRGGSPVTLELADGRHLEAGAVVMASNVPFHARVAMHTKQAPYRTFVIALPIAEDAMPEGLVWDLADPYHYVRTYAPKGGRPHLLVGGEDEKTGQPSDTDPFGALFRWARRHFRVEESVTHAWSGQVLEPADGLGYAGLAPGGEENLYLITGDSGNGVTHATLGATLIDALLHGDAVPERALFSPSRKPIRGAKRWFQENLNVAAQFRDWIAPGDHEDDDALAPGEASVTRNGLHRIARHRDEAGRLHAFSARCPHLGCVVRWNDLEKTWDCPCHGSRFDPVSGRVLNGPATQGLTPAGAIHPSREERRP